MSVTMMSSVFKMNMPELKTDKGKTVPDSTAKFVLLTLADHANDEGEGAYPGVRTICRKTNMSTSTVVNALNALRTNGFTQLVGRSKRETYNYTILATRIAEFQWLESSDSTGRNDSVSATETNPLNNHPVKPSVKVKAKTTADPRSSSPEIILYRSIRGQYPKKHVYDIVIKAIQKINERLGRDATRDDILPFWEEWASHSAWNPDNLAWLKDWAVTGVIPTYQKQQQSKQPQPPQDNFMAELAAKKQRLQQEANA